MLYIFAPQRRYVILKRQPRSSAGHTLIDDGPLSNLTCYHSRGAAIGGCDDFRLGAAMREFLSLLSPFAHSRRSASMDGARRLSRGRTAFDTAPPGLSILLLSSSIIRSRPVNGVRYGRHWLLDKYFPWSNLLLIELSPATQSRVVYYYYTMGPNSPNTKFLECTPIRLRNKTHFVPGHQDILCRPISSIPISRSLIGIFTVAFYPLGVTT